MPVTSKDEIGQLAEAFNHMAEELRTKERIKDTFGKYLDPRVVARLIDTSQEDMDQAERRVATVLFSDLKGFTSMSEQLTATAMVRLLNRYFTVVSDQIRAHNGVVEKYIGDAVMAFWAPPFSAGDDHAASACLAALAHRDAVIALRPELPQLLGLRRNVPELAVRMGLATGEVVIGTIGAPTAKSYAAIGDITNLASRLEGVNKVYGTTVILAEETYRLAQQVIDARELDTVIVVGKSEPVRIFELAGPRRRGRRGPARAPGPLRRGPRRPIAGRTGTPPSSGSPSASADAPTTAPRRCCASAAWPSGRPPHRPTGTASGTSTRSDGRPSGPSAPRRPSRILPASLPPHERSHTMREAVVVASSRTPLAKSHRGSFNITRPDDLAAHCIKDVLGKAPQLDPKEVEDVILGCAQPNGPQGSNVARVALIRAGLPVSVAGTTVNRFCSSGLQAIAMAAHQIMMGGAEAAIGGGLESISMMKRDGDPNPWVKEKKPGIYMVMGDTAEVVAKRYNVTRQAQDEYSLW